jgi:two-component system chemotaxis sensor kinase CheA
LKGAARVVKQPEIAELAHAVEDALAPLRDRPSGASRNVVDAILGHLDEMTSRVATLARPSEAGTPDRGTPDRGTPDRAAPAGDVRADETIRTVKVDVADMDALLDGLAVAGVQFGTMRGAIASVERARNLGDLLVGQLSAPRRGVAGGPASAPMLARTRSLAEELQAMVRDLEHTLGTSLDHLEREVRQVREAAERLRLVEVKAVFASLERVARDTSRAVGRSVTFDAQGGEVRLDAHVLGVAQGALVQLVRNAVAHGIESEGERIAGGKPPAGQVVLQVARRGNRVAFVCQDDGRGLDLDAVRRVAENKGLIAKGTRVDDAEALTGLLLRGGLTTSGAVTEVAGRGVGLDIVRAAAARLGGDVSVRTSARRGTSFELAVPAMTSSLTALHVEADGIVAAIPLDSVRRTLRLPAEAVARTASGESIVFDERAIPFAPLARLLFGRAPQDASRRMWPMVVVAADGGLAAVGVDRLGETANIVVRPLPAPALPDPIVAGASLDAAGDPRIVLDPEAIVSAVVRAGLIAGEGPSTRPLVLVVDDSLTTRMLEQSILESAGYEVDLASSAEEGLDMARRRRYGLFLVDVEMPGMDGFAFLERVRADPALSEVPSILVTSRMGLEDRKRGMEAGAVAYIVKSAFDQNELLEIIRRHVR